MNIVPLYCLENVAKHYGAACVLEIAQLELWPGEVLGLLGPTGAGKSTLLRLLAGLEAPTQGRLVFDGVEFSSHRLSCKTRRRIAMVHQRPCLLSGTVRFNVEYGLRIRKVANRAALVAAILRELGIDELADKPVRTLSGGQVHLVALARVLVLRPEVLLLDEPTASLDPGRVARVEQALARLQREYRMTIVWATHNLFQVRRVAQRVALLWEGRLIEVAPTEQFFRSPADPRTRDFLEGRMVY